MGEYWTQSSFGASPQYCHSCFGFKFQTRTLPPSFIYRVWRAYTTQRGSLYLESVSSVGGVSGDGDVSISRILNHHYHHHHHWERMSTYVTHVCVCVFVCTESSGADVTGAKTLQRHDEPGTPAGIWGTPVFEVRIKNSIKKRNSPWPSLRLCSRENWRLRESCFSRRPSVFGSRTEASCLEVKSAGFSCSNRLSFSVNCCARAPITPDTSLRTASRLAWWAPAYGHLGLSLSGCF